MIELYDPARDLAPVNLQEPEGQWRPELPLSGGAGVEEKNTADHAVEGVMGMAEYHHIRSDLQEPLLHLRVGVLRSADAMGDQDFPAFRIHHPGDRQGLKSMVGIHVSPHRHHRRNLFQFCEQMVCTDIPGMENKVSTFQLLEKRGKQVIMGI